ncbi:MAG: hypothetical protein ACRYGM_01740 [Janthinobacterium lividum]
MLRTVAGFVHSQAGRIHLNGLDVAALPPRQRSVGIVFQSSALFPHMAVGGHAFAGMRSDRQCRGVERRGRAGTTQQPRHE